MSSLERMNQEEVVTATTPVFNEWMNGYGCTLTIPTETDAVVIKFDRDRLAEDFPFQISDQYNNQLADEILTLSHLATFVALGREHLQDPRILPALEEGAKKVFHPLFMRERNMAKLNYKDGEIDADELEERMDRTEEIMCLLFLKK